jgi:hypothetical protein
LLELYTISRVVTITLHINVPHKSTRGCVIGELVVVHEITMAVAVTNLKRLLAVCGERKVFIITPCLLYANASSWGAVHSSGTFYTRMALYMLDNLFRVPFAKPAPPPNKEKRPHRESTSSSGGNSSYSDSGSKNRSARREDRSGGNRRDCSDRREPGFIRGGSRGGSRSGNHGGS